MQRFKISDVILLHKRKFCEKWGRNSKKGAWHLLQNKISIKISIRLEKSPSMTLLLSSDLSIFKFLNQCFGVLLSQMQWLPILL